MSLRESPGGGLGDIISDSLTLALIRAYPEESILDTWSILRMVQLQEGKVFSPLKCVWVDLPYKGIEYFLGLISLSTALFYR